MNGGGASVGEGHEWWACWRFGAYAPRRFMRDQHMAPAEALAGARALHGLSAERS